MTKYTLINPSDAIYFEVDGEIDEIAAAVAILFLGQGRYGLDGPDGCVVPIWLFGGHEEWFRDRGWDVNDAIAEKTDAAADFLDTLKYEGERTSMNNIGQRAAACAAALRKVKKGGAGDAEKAN